MPNTKFPLFSVRSMDFSEQGVLGRRTDGLSAPALGYMNSCKGCDADLPSDANGAFCARCVLEGMLDAPDQGGGEASAGMSLVGESFGDYEIIEEIGRGGMGVVFKARQKSLDRVVALKLIQGGILAGKKAEQRFRREASTVARLDHPNVVPIYEIGQDAGYSFFSMRLVEGASLAKLAREYVGRREQAARLLAKVARAIQFAHERGVLHRDIKPHNILVDARGEPYITDFGLAKLEEDNAQMTGTGDVFGTPSFMAPEQAAGNQHLVDRRTDVYGLGAVLYHLLTGQAPFEGKTSFEVMKSVIEREPLNPRRLKSDLPDDLAAICIRCLRKEPGERYASAGLLADDLERWLQRRPVAAESSGGMGGRRRWSRRTAAGLIVVGALAAAALFLTSPPEPPPDQNPTVAPTPETARSEPDQPSNFLVTPGQAPALLADTFEIPTETEDKSQVPIRKGNDPATGLPWEIRERRTGMHFMLVPPGTFTMGVANSDKDKQEQQIEGPYYLGKYEVTIEEFRFFAEAKSYQTGQEKDGVAMYYPFRGGRNNREYTWSRLRWEHTPRHPLSLIRPADVEAFLTWMNGDAVGSFDVPTEVEWEYAARGGPGSPYTWPSNAPDSDRRGNLQDRSYFEAIKSTGRRPGPTSHQFGKGRDDGHPFTAPVGSYEPNPLGLYDIIGNVQEMCRLSKNRWGYRGYCFNSGGEGRPLLERQMINPVESSFLLGCRLVWRPPMSVPTNATQSVTSFLMGKPGKAQPFVGSRLHPEITRGYTKPVPRVMHPRLPIMIPRPNFRPLAANDVATMRRQADEYATDHPTHYRSVLERYEQVWAETPSGPDRDALLDLIRGWLAKMDQAAQAARNSREQKMNELADAGDFRAAFLVWADLSPEVRPFKDEWKIFELIEARVPAANRGPLQPGELERQSTAPASIIGKP